MTLWMGLWKEFREFAVIEFLIVALSVFVMVKAMNKVMRAREQAPQNR